MRPSRPAARGTSLTRVQISPAFRPQFPSVSVSVSCRGSRYWTTIVYSRRRMDFHQSPTRNLRSLSRPTRARQRAASPKFSPTSARLHIRAKRAKSDAETEGRFTLSHPEACHRGSCAPSPHRRKSDGERGRKRHPSTQRAPQCYLVGKIDKSNPKVLARTHNRAAANARPPEQM